MVSPESSGEEILMAVTSIERCVLDDDDRCSLDKVDVGT
jgi:hypothetical protein